MAKNPLLQKKFDEGVRAGIEIGLDQGIQKTTGFFLERFKAFLNTPGIGEKTAEKFKEAIGLEYFEENE